MTLQKKFLVTKIAPFSDQTQSKSVNMERRGSIKLNEDYLNKLTLLIQNNNQEVG